MTDLCTSGGSIEELRKVIDATDTELFGLLEKRAKLARSIGKLKAAGAVYKPEREREIFERTVARAKAEGTLLSEEAIRNIVREIVSACRAVEALPCVAFLGPKGTFTEEAVVRQFGSSFKALACESLDEVFHEAASGTADFAVVPVENSTEGIVTRTADLLLTTPLKVIGEVNVAVHHNLMNCSGKREDIVEVHAHPQALAQCRIWLMTHLPQAKLVPSSSNAQAAKEAAADPKVAARTRCGALRIAYRSTCCRRRSAQLHAFSGARQGGGPQGAKRASQNESHFFGSQPCRIAFGCARPLCQVQGIHGATGKSSGTQRRLGLQLLCGR